MTEVTEFVVFIHLVQSILHFLGVPAHTHVFNTLSYSRVPCLHAEHSHKSTTWYGASSPLTFRNNERI
jgi:hypothetical protein